MNVFHTYVIGYQRGTTDGFNPRWIGGKQIDDPYLDGVSITYGKSRKHLWSLAIGFSTNGNCPCSTKPGPLPPPFVRDYYYCDSGCIASSAVPGRYYSAALWDGEGCSSNYSCCSQAGMPYFYQRLPVPVKEDIEVRICNNEIFSNEGVLVGTMELYVL